jgi:hypothetical protein
MYSTVSLTTVAFERYQVLLCEIGVMASCGSFPSINGVKVFIYPPKNRYVALD